MLLDPRTCTAISLGTQLNGAPQRGYGGSTAQLAAGQLVMCLQVVSGLASAAASCGAVIRTGCEVAEILVDPRSSAVCGVRLKGGEVLAASTVVCNRWA